ncbi:MAG: ABC-2 transporter permease [Dysosmobacter sp.]
MPPWPTDQRSRWDRFTRMLPYSDRTVVLSRYSLGWISLSIGAVAVAICQGVLTCLPLPAKLSANLSPGFVFAALCVGCLLLDPEYTSHPSLRHGKGPVGRHSHYLSRLCFRRRAQRIGQ